MLYELNRRTETLEKRISSYESPRSTNGCETGVKPITFRRDTTTGDCTRGQCTGRVLHLNCIILFFFGRKSEFRGLKNPLRTSIPQAINHRLNLQNASQFYKKKKIRELSKISREYPSFSDQQKLCHDHGSVQNSEMHSIHDLF